MQRQKKHPFDNNPEFHVFFVFMYFLKQIEKKYNYEYVGTRIHSKINLSLSLALPYH